MKAKQLAEELLKNPELDIAVFESEKFFDNIPVQTIKSTHISFIDDDDDKDYFQIFITPNPKTVIEQDEITRFCYDILTSCESEEEAFNEFKKRAKLYV